MWDLLLSFGFGEETISSSLQQSIETEGTGHSKNQKHLPLKENPECQF